jgi:2'-5' RNA ligase
MRLFVAIELGDEARHSVAAEQRRLAHAIGDGDRVTIRWIGVDQLHLTLIFLGEVAESLVDPLVTILSSDLPHAPFALTLAGLGVFPPRGAPRALWIGTAHGGSALAEIHMQVVERIQPLGIELERRPFRPHLTIGRWRGSRPSAARRALASDRGAEIARVWVESVVLFQSRLSSKAPEYTRLARATLTRCS